MEDSLHRLVSLREKLWFHSYILQLKASTGQMEKH